MNTDLCNQCNVIENEMHLLCSCTLYNDLRSKYLGNTSLSEQEVIIMLKSTKEDTVLNLALFVKNALSVRSSIV